MLYTKMHHLFLYIYPYCTNGNFAAQFGLGSNPARTQNNLKTSSMAPPVLLHKPCSPNYPSDRQNAHRCTACTHKLVRETDFDICPQHKLRSSTPCSTTQISLLRTSCKTIFRSAPCIGPNCTSGNFAAQFGLGSNPARTQNNLKTSSMAPPVLLHKPCSPNYPSDRQNAHRCTACTHKLVRETDFDICPPHKPRSSTPCSTTQTSLLRTSCKTIFRSAP